jgi:hypothetical protein
MHFGRSIPYNTAPYGESPIGHLPPGHRAIPPVWVEHFLKVYTEAGAVRAVFPRRKRHR